VGTRVGVAVGVAVDVGTGVLVVIAAACIAVGAADDDASRQPISTKARPNVSSKNASLTIVFAPGLLFECVRRDAKRPLL
jgi:hypothetical protein